MTLQRLEKHSFYGLRKITHMWVTKEKVMLFIDLYWLSCSFAVWREKCLILNVANSNWKWGSKTLEAYSSPAHRLVLIAVLQSSPASQAIKEIDNECPAVGLLHGNEMINNSVRGLNRQTERACQRREAEQQPVFGFAPCLAHVEAAQGRKPSKVHFILNYGIEIYGWVSGWRTTQFPAEHLLALHILLQDSPPIWMMCSESRHLLTQPFVRRQFVPALRAVEENVGRCGRFRE